MSNPPSVLPPSPFFNGIVYNPTDYSSSLSSGSFITFAQASNLYIRKTIADTVSGITNFINGITVSTIITKTASTVCNLWTTSTAEINIGTYAGRAALIHIGDGDNNLAGSGVHINNGLNTASNVQILNGTGSTGTINLGSSTSTTNCNCPLTLTYSPSTITSNKLGYILPSTGSTSAFLGTTSITNFRTLALGVGVWNVLGQIQQSSGTIVWMRVSISTSTTVLDSLAQSSVWYPSAAASTNSLQVSRFITNTSATTYYLLGQASDPVNATGIVFQALRVA